MHTHLHKESGTWFTMGECEFCGGEVQEVNAVKVSPNDFDTLIDNMGIIEVDSLPPELDVDEDGETFCEACGGASHYEDDGQPDELTEWMDFDPDC